jgi:hypothetical protein
LGSFHGNNLILNLFGRRKFGRAGRSWEERSWRKGFLMENFEYIVGLG